MPSGRKVPKSLLPKDFFGEGPDTTLLYFNEIGSSVGLSRSEEERLYKLIKTGDEEALERLVVANLRFVIGVAKGYQNRGLPLADLIQAGNYGLIVAAKRFDASKGFKFISYAVWWIRQAILQALGEEARNVVLSTNRFGLMNKISKLEVGLTQRLGRTPRSDELAEKLEEKIEDVEEARRLMLSERSLDSPIHKYEDDSLQLLDLIPSDTPFRDNLEEEDIKEILTKAINACLDSREKIIMEHYFGLNGRTAIVLEKIGEIIGLTRERVRQLKERALGKLRAYFSRNKIRHLL